MTRKYLSALIAVATIGMVATGCLSNKTNSEATLHYLRVVDAVTKIPLAGAEVKLSAPGMTMAHRTDEHGMIDVGTQTFHSTPRPEEIEVTMQGYNPVSFRLTNGLPATVEIAPLQGKR